MVYSSVYRRSYREPSWDDYSKKEFFSKLQYRSDRRSVEHRHQPWKWNGETESDDENVEEIPADDGSYEGGRRWRKRVDRMGRSIPKQAWEEEKKDIQQPVHGKSLPLPEKLTYGEEDENKQKQSHEAKRMNHYNQKDEDDPKYSATDKAIVLPKEQECEEKKANNHKQSHHARPDNRNHRPSKKNYRARSTSPGKKRLAKDERNKVPFLPYGMANEGPVDMWKTHNVLASKAEVSVRKIIIERKYIIVFIILRKQLVSCVEFGSLFLIFAVCGKVFVPHKISTYEYIHEVKLQDTSFIYLVPVILNKIIIIHWTRGH